MSGLANFLVSGLFKDSYASSTAKGVKEKLLVTRELPAELYAKGLPTDTVLNKKQEAPVFVKTIEHFSFV